MKHSTLSIVMLSFVGGTLLAEEAQKPNASQALIDNEVQKDVLLRAVLDELERGREGLELADMGRPYFIEYALFDGVRVSIAARLGAVTNQDSYRSRQLRSDIRVGSYELDNSNYRGGGGFRFGPMFSGGGSAPVPIENDYGAIRQAIWWATDRDYKEAVETFAAKKAFMEGKIIEDKPADFSREESTVHFDDLVEPSVDVDQLAALAIDVSEVFRDYAEIKSSNIAVSAIGANHYLANTEGTCLRKAGTTYSVTVTATVQADDGMDLVDALSVHVADSKDLPSADGLSGRCRTMAERLIAVKKAPKLESYAGPVLFDAEAAAGIFYQRMAGNFTGGQRPVGSRTDPDDFANKLNKRILPRTVSVVDDPVVEAIGGVPVMGHYEYDDQGVPARRVEVVQGGRLKALLMSRNPSREFGSSNGHGRDLRAPRAALGCMIVSADDATDEKSLKEELIEAFQDEGIEFGIRVASLGAIENNDAASRFGIDMDSLLERLGESGRAVGTMPLVMYKVYADGREELVRGAEIARIDLRSFKRILAMGDTPFVLNTGGGSGRTVAAPAMLFEELDLAEIDRDFDKPPILASPIARGAGEAERG